MKKITILIIFALIIQIFFPFQLLAEEAKQNKNLVIPKDKVLLIELLDELNSGKNKTGDNFSFETRENLVVDNVTVIPYGTRGAGTLSKVQKAGAWGKGGYFDMNFGTITAINNKQVPFEFGKSAQGAQKQFLGTVLPIISLIAFWPLAFFGFTKGEEARMSKGSQMYINVRNDVDLGITAEDYSASTKSKEEKPQEEAKKTETSLSVENFILCKKLSASGDPVEVSNVFKNDAESISVVLYLNNPKEKTAVTVKWCNVDGLFFAKQFDISAGASKITDLISNPKGQTFKAGQWKIEVEQANKTIKSVNFSVN